MLTNERVVHEPFNQVIPDFLDLPVELRVRTSPAKESSHPDWNHEKRPDVVNFSHREKTLCRESVSKPGFHLCGEACHKVDNNRITQRGSVAMTFKVEGIVYVAMPGEDTMIR